MKREFIEIPKFLKMWESIDLSDDDLAEMEDSLCQHPQQGSVVSGTGGLRKMRWGAEDKGKRAGARVVYVDFVEYEKVYLIAAYPKNEKVDLTEDEKKQIKNVIVTIENELGRKAKK